MKTGRVFVLVFWGILGTWTNAFQTSVRRSSRIDSISSRVVPFPVQQLRSSSQLHSVWKPVDSSKAPKNKPKLLEVFRLWWKRSWYLLRLALVAFSIAWAALPPRSAVASPPSIKQPLSAMVQPSAVEQALKEHRSKIMAQEQADYEEMQSVAQEIELSQGRTARQRFEADYIKQQQRKEREKVLGLKQLKRNLLEQGIHPSADLEGQRQVAFYELGLDLGQVHGTPQWMEQRLERYAYGQSMASQKAYHRQIIASMVQDMKNRGVDPLQQFEDRGSEAAARILAMPQQQAQLLANRYSANIQKYGRIASARINLLNAWEEAGNWWTNPRKSQSTYGDNKARAVLDEKESGVSFSLRDLSSKLAESKIPVTPVAAVVVLASGGLWFKVSADNTIEQAKEMQRQELYRFLTGTKMPPGSRSGLFTGSLSNKVDSSDDEMAETKFDIVNGSGPPSPLNVAEEAKTDGDSLSNAQSSPSVASTIPDPVHNPGGFTFGYGADEPKAAVAAPATVPVAAVNVVVSHAVPAPVSGPVAAAAVDASHAVPAPVSVPVAAGNVVASHADDALHSQDVIAPKTPVVPVVSPTVPWEDVKDILSQKQTANNLELYDLIGPESRAPKFALFAAKMLTFGAPELFPHITLLSCDVPCNTFNVSYAEKMLVETREAAQLNEDEAVEIFEKIVKCMLADLVEVESSGLRRQDDPVTLGAINTVVDFMAHVSVVYDALSDGFVHDPPKAGRHEFDGIKSQFEQIQSTYAGG